MFLVKKYSFPAFFDEYFSVRFDFKISISTTVSRPVQYRLGFFRTGAHKMSVLNRSTELLQDFLIIFLGEIQWIAFLCFFLGHNQSVFSCQ